MTPERAPLQPPQNSSKERKPLLKHWLSTGPPNEKGNKAKKKEPKKLSRLLHVDRGKQSWSSA